jgi:formylglycine-generating enzyme required for sulfatase activity
LLARPLVARYRLDVQTIARIGDQPCSALAHVRGLAGMRSFSRHARRHRDASPRPDVSRRRVVLVALALGLALAAGVALAYLSVQPPPPRVSPSIASQPVTGAVCAGGVGADHHCGADHDRDCCEATLVPATHFHRSFDRGRCTDASAEANVSSFGLDVFEVTVGRFRAFLAAGGGTRAHAPPVGSGAHPRDPSTGWRAEWTDALLEDRTALERALACGPAATWTHDAGPNDDRPINCITWYEAFAFCASDGGRLPTEAEWNAAAAGGEEERERPWGTGVARTTAVFGEASPFAVGSCTLGNGRWGQTDLVGNVWEWTLDAVDGEGLLPREGADPCTTRGMPRPCDDCVASGAPGLPRVLRGAGFGMSSIAMLSAVRRADPPTQRHQVFGARCVRADASVASDRGTTSVAASERTWRGYARPAESVEQAAALDLPTLAGGEDGTVLVVRGCMWDPDFDSLATGLEEAQRGWVAAGVTPLLLVVEGDRRGQATDLPGVARAAQVHGLTFAVATEEPASDRCDGAVWLGADGRVLGEGASRDVLDPSSQLGTLLSERARSRSASPLGPSPRP